MTDNLQPLRLRHFQPFYSRLLLIEIRVSALDTRGAIDVTLFIASYIPEHRWGQFSSWLRTVYHLVHAIKR